ncbi:MAG: HlyC/CorC family transporter [Bacteroidetes bacterium]|nr:HlyC/CorC family transporter [Bacteroidota bacterium]
MLGNIALTLFFVFLNGFFVAAEFAIVKVRASALELKAREGNVLAVVARHMLSHLDAYLSATQLGITLASLGLGWIGESVVSDIIQQFVVLVGWELSAPTLHTISITIAFSIITVLHIVLGEQAPKTMAIRRSETVTLAVALPLRAFMFVFRPLILALNWMSNTILRMAGIQPAPEHEVHSPDEIRYLIQQSTEGGLESTERELIENVFEFTETTAGQVMIPRSNIIGLEIGMSSSEMLDYVMEEGYSRLPVYRGSIDTIVGIVYAKDLLTLMHHRDLIIIQDILRPAIFVQEDLMLQQLLRDMQRRKVHMVIVLDEFGGTAGLVTFEDIMEEIVGNIQDEYDDESEILATPTQEEFELAASVHIGEANDVLPIPLPDEGEYETIGGLINAHSGRVPKQGDVVTLEHYVVTILESTPRRVERVRMKVRK